LLKSHICAYCLGSGHHITFLTEMGIIPFILKQQEVEDKTRMVPTNIHLNFIAEIGWDAYIERVWDSMVKVKEVKQETCSSCLGEGVIYDTE
jgi:hypothetical protein